MTTSPQEPGGPEEPTPEPDSPDSAPPNPDTEQPEIRRSGDNPTIDVDPDTVD